MNEILTKLKFENRITRKKYFLIFIMKIYLIALLILLIMYFIPRQESFECINENKLDKPKDIPLHSVNCNKIPNYPNSLEPNTNIIEYPEVPFERLAQKNGNYTFIIPELKYDGIYSRKIIDNKCVWTTESNVPDTYGTDSFLHIPEKSIKTISYPECSMLDNYLS